MADGIDEGVDRGPVPHIRVRGVVKSYAGNRALNGVSLDIARATVHALVGANGAGKSTLGKIIGGVVRLDEGQVFVEGRPVRYASPRDARRDGVAVIAQELALVPGLSVMENVLLGVESRRMGLLAREAMEQRYAALVERWGFQLPGDALVGDLRLADQQKVEVLRAVSCDAHVIVMDEPTSSLTGDEVQTLHEIIRGLRRQGTTVVYVSHFLDEILDLADTVTVLRNGNVIRTVPCAQETQASLVSGMFGAAADLAYSEKRAVDAPVALDVRHLRRDRVLHDVSLVVREGEIVGLAGLVGSGRSELVRCLFGIDRHHGGAISVGGEERSIRSPRDAMAAGLAFVPESRKEQGLFLEMSVAANTTVAHLGSSTVSRAGVVAPKAERAQVGQLLRDLSVHPASPDAPVGTLSGGNQQKVLIAKSLFKKPRVLLVDEPTRGVDVGARAAIHRLIIDLAEQGVAVVLISSDIEEVLGLAHRVLVMRRGAVVAEFGMDPSMGDVMAAAFGVAPEQGASAE